jgi:hypothetical protein
LFVQREALSAKSAKLLQEHAFDSATLADQVRAFRPSVLVVEQWALVPLISQIDKPLVIDLHGSLLLENVYRRGDTDLVLDAGSKIEALARADLLLVPAGVQVHHFASWATLAGFDPRELPLQLMPLAMTRQPKPRKTKKPALRLVYGGARWPWIDSLSALRTAANTVSSLPDARLDVFTFEPPRHGLDFEEDLGTWPQVLEELGGREKEGITLHEGEPHSSWQRFLLEEATIALDLWKPNPERMLAATTRSVEFLWAGLGIATVTGAAWSEALTRTGAGWALTPDDDDSLRQLLEHLASNPAHIAAASSAATSLILDDHDLSNAGRALLSFCETPTRAIRSAHTLSQSLVMIREEQIAEELRSLQAAHELEHKQLVASHIQEQQEDRTRHKAEVNSLTAEHRKEVSLLVQNNQRDVVRLETLHQDKLRELVLEGRVQGKAITREAQKAAKEAAKDHRSAMSAAAKEQRTQMQGQEKAHRKESDALVSKWQAQVEGLEGKLATRRREQESILSQAAKDHSSELQGVVADHRAQVNALTAQHSAHFKEQADKNDAALQRVASDHRAQVNALTAQHSAHFKEQADKNDAALSAQESRAREELDRAVQSHRVEVEALVLGNRAQIEDLAAERQNEVQRLVGQSRAELEQADERHRAETLARLQEMEQRHQELQRTIEELKGHLASERRRVKEERTKLEVELRAEMSARELELQQQMVSREAELGQLLEQANRGLARKLRDRLGSSGDGQRPNTRLAPAARLAKLWGEHAIDHIHDEHEE